MNLPSRVEELVKEITEKSPKYSEAQVWATAWSIYCKHIKPGDTPCSMGPDGYLTKEAAVAVLRNLAHQHPNTRGYIVPFIRSASLADKVMGPEWRSKKGALNSVPISTAVLPKVVQKVLTEVRFNKRKVGVGQATSFSMYSAGDDGAKGFTALIDIDTNQSSVTWGEWGGGALGKKPGPVDDTNTPKKPLPDHLVVVQGQIGGRDPYASITCTPTTFPRLTGAARMATRKTAALIEHLGPYSKLVDMVVREIKEYMQSHPYDKDPKTLATGFIYSLFQALNDRRIEQALFNLFEHRGPSLNTGWAWQLAGGIRNRLGSGAHAKVIAAAIGMALLAKTKQPRLAVMYEELINGLLARELEDVGAPSGGKAMNPSQTFEAAIDDQIKELVRDALSEIGKNPAAAENLVWLVAEDVNWRSIQAVGPTDAPVDQEFVSSISQRLDWSLDSVAVFGTALLRAVGLRQKAEAIKRQALAEFPDSFEDMGPARVARVAHRYLAATQKQNKVAFNKFNAPELVSQLLAVLEQEGLKDALNQIKMKKVPELVEKAWAARGKTASNLRVAMNFLQVLSELFQGVQPYVRNWRQFLTELVVDLESWPEQWGTGLNLVKVAPGHTTDYRYTGDQIGGYGYRGNRGFDPPEYAEADITVADTVDLILGCDLNLRTFPKAFALSYRSLVKDPAGFMRAISDLVENRNARVMLGKVLSTSLQGYIEADPIGSAEVGIDEILETAKEMGDSGWSPQYDLKSLTISKAHAKVTSTGLSVEVEGEAKMEVTDVTPPEPDYDGPEPGDY